MSTPPNNFYHRMLNNDRFVTVIIHVEILAVLTLLCLLAYDIINIAQFGVAVGIVTYFLSRFVLKHKTPPELGLIFSNTVTNKLTIAIYAVIVLLMIGYGFFRQSLVTCNSYHKSKLFSKAIKNTICHPIEKKIKSLNPLIPIEKLEIDTLNAIKLRFTGSIEKISHGCKTYKKNKNCERLDSVLLVQKEKVVQYIGEENLEDRWPVITSSILESVE